MERVIETKFLESTFESDRVFGRGMLRRLGNDRWFLSLAGDENERGLQHGFLAADLIDRQVLAMRRDFRSLFRLLGATSFGCRWATRLLGLLYWQKYPRAVRREIQSIARGMRLAGRRVFIADLWYINSWPDSEGCLRSVVRKIFAFSRLFQMPVVPAGRSLSPHCCSIGLWGNRTREAQRLFGQNVDFSIKPGIVVVACSIRPDVGVGLFGARTAGAIGFLTAISEEGTAFGEVGRVTRPYRVAVPWAMAGTLALERGMGATASAGLVSEMGYGHHFSFLGKEDACLLEVTPSSRAEYVPKASSGSMYSAELSKHRLGRKVQIRSVERKNWRRDIRYARRRDSIVKRSLERGSIGGSVDPERMKQVLTRTALPDNLAQALFEIDTGKVHLRWADTSGTAARLTPWNEWHAWDYWVRLQKEDREGRHCVRIDGPMFATQSRSYTLVILFGTDRTSFDLRLSAGGCWQSPLFPRIDSCELRVASSGELVAVLAPPC